MNRRGFFAMLAALAATPAIPRRPVPPIRYVYWVSGRGWVPMSPELWTAHQQAMLKFRQLTGTNAVSQIEGGSCT
jgi:hypothetical protein